MNIITTLAPTAEPLNIAEVVAHVVADANTDTQLLTDLITGGRELVESHTWRRLLVQTVVVSQDNWNGYVIELPIAPIIEVTQVTYVDTNGTTQTLNPSIWQADLRSHIPRIMPTYGNIWPPVQLLTPNAVQVTCVVGYGAAFTTNYLTDASTLSVSGQPWQNGNVIQLYNSGGALPAGLLPSTNYYIVNVTANGIQLSLTLGGVAIALTGNGTGTSYAGLVPRRLRQAMLLWIGMMYNNREAVLIEDRIKEIELNFGLQSILDAYALKDF